MKNSLIFLLAIILSSCSYFSKNRTPDADVVARVNEEYLFASELQAITKGLKGEDSVSALKRYAEQWVRKKLLFQKATENIPADDPSILRKVEDYREALLLYEYEKELINQKLDTAIRQEEFNTWYDKIKADFPLDKDVFLVNFIKLNKDLPQLDNARKWILKPKDEEDIRKLEGYCREFASLYSIDAGVWHDKENILKIFPLNEYEVTSLSSTRSYREFKTPEAFWYIRLTEVAKKEQPSPLPLVREKIARAIIEKRKLLLLERTYNKVYQDGTQSKSFEIFVN